MFRTTKRRWSRWARTARPSSPARGGRLAQAFTLIELLLVLVILTVLAAVVVPKFAGRSKQARVTAAGADISNIESAADTFELDTGRYPATLDDLMQQPSDVKVWNGPYLKRSVPNDPWGNAYIYKSPGDHNSSGYDLYSFGPDGQEGGGDDIDNWSQH